ncbi:MAG: transposase [Thermomicrobiales bacterium]
MISLLPQTRVSQVRPLAHFVLGMLWAGRVSPRAVAAALPLAVADASTEQRLRRWLVNERVQVDRLWRTLPVAWRVLPQQTAWPQPQIVHLQAMFTEGAAALPPGCTVTVMGDRGLPRAEVIDACRAVGWEALFRLSADARQGHRVRLADGQVRPLWELVSGPGQRWSGPVEVFKAAGWRTGELTIRWDRGQTEPWRLVSTRPGGAARVREYRRRAHAEATYAECKQRGWHIEASRITALERLARLLLVRHLALWWSTQLGLGAIRRGERWWYDRRGPRALSVIRIGRAALADILDRQLTVPPLPFRRTASGFVFTWLA